MKAIFIKAGVVTGVASFSTGAIASNDPDVVTIYQPDDFAVNAGDTYADGVFTPGTPPAPPAPVVSPVQFKLLFTAQERVAMRTARATDPVIDDFFDIIEDPRLTGVDLGLQSTKDAIAYLNAQGLLTDERAAEVLTGALK